MAPNGPSPATFVPPSLMYALASLLSKLETVQYLVPSERNARRETVCREAMAETYAAGVARGRQLAEQERNTPTRG